MRLNLRKICFMHQASIGDTLMVTPVYRALKECYPACRQVVVTGHAGYELLRGNPHIDTLLRYEKGDPVLPVIKNIWRADASVIFDYHYRNALYSFLALIPKRIGYGKDFINVKLYDEPLEMYEPLKYLAAVKQLGIHTDNLTLTRPVPTEQEKLRVTKLLAEIKSPAQKLILFVPFSLAAIKDWEPAKYREIISRVKSLGHAAAIIGGKSETERAAKEFPDAVNLAGTLSLRESAELISRADLQISGCTAMLHICSTTDTPAIALYGPTIPEQWAPKKNCTVITHRLPCSPCYNIEGKPLCNDNRCIKSISVDEVWRVAEKILRSRNEH